MEPKHPFKHLRSGPENMLCMLQGEQLTKGPSYTACKFNPELAPKPGFLPMGCSQRGTVWEVKEAKDSLHKVDVQYIVNTANLQGLVLRVP